MAETARRAAKRTVDVDRTKASVCRYLSNRMMNLQRARQLGDRELACAEGEKARGRRRTG